MSRRGSGAESDEPVEMVDAFRDRSASECLRSWPGEGACSTLSIISLMWMEGGGKERRRARLRPTVQPNAKPLNDWAQASHTLHPRGLTNYNRHPSVRASSVSPSYHHHPPTINSLLFSSHNQSYSFHPNMVTGSYPSSTMLHGAKHPVRERLRTE